MSSRGGGWLSPGDGDLVPKFESPTLSAARSRAARIDPASRGFITATVVVTLLAFASSFAISAAAQVWVGEQIGLPIWLRFAVPVAIDMPLIAFALGAVARRAQGESAILPWLSLALFTCASVAANAWHGLVVAGENGALVVGVVAVSALVPMGVLLTSESALGILVSRPASTDRQHLAALQRVADRGQLAKPSHRRSAAETKDLDAAARDLASSGETRSAIAKRLGISVEAVRKALAAPAVEPEFRL